MACDFDLGDKDLCSSTLEVGSLNGATEYDYFIKDTALDVRYKFTQTTDGSGNVDLDLSGVAKSAGRTYQVTAELNGSPVDFTVATLSYESLCFSFVNTENA